MRFQAGIQIVLILISVVIIMTVIRPELDKIRSKQNELAKFNDAIEKAGAYNETLQAKINQADNILTSDLAALDRFLPDAIDPVKVARDLENIILTNELSLQSITVGEVTAVTVSNLDKEEMFMMDDTGVAVYDEEGSASKRGLGLVSQTLALSVAGTYEQMKYMLRDIERNSYPLRLTKFGFAVEDDSSDEELLVDDQPLYTYTLEFEVYALSANQ